MCFILEKNLWPFFQFLKNIHIKASWDFFELQTKIAICPWTHLSTESFDLFPHFSRVPTWKKLSTIINFARHFLLQILIICRLVSMSTLAIVHDGIKPERNGIKRNRYKFNAMRRDSSLYLFAWEHRFYFVQLS